MNPVALRSGSRSGLLVDENGFPDQQLAGLFAMVGLREMGDVRASGRADLCVDIYFSRTPITAVPESSTLVMLLLGLMPLALMRRR